MERVSSIIRKHFLFLTQCLDGKVTLNQVILECPPDQVLKNQLQEYLPVYGDKPFTEFVDHYFTTGDKGDYLVSRKITRGQLRGPGTLDYVLQAVTRRGEEIERYQLVASL